MSIAMEKGPHRGRITVDEYHRMAEVGLLAPDARVELIEGVIVDVPPMGPSHASAVCQLDKLLHNAVRERAIVWCRLPIRLSAFSEPQPDLALHVGRADFYRQRHPTAEDILLVIEVSDASLRHDLSTKAALYAQHGIRELWVFNGRSQSVGATHATSLCTGVSNPSVCRGLRFSFIAMLSNCA